jgi:hypothetical protein
VDFLASFASFLGQTVPPHGARDSRNTWAALVGKDEVGTEIILEQAKGVAVRKGSWKYFEVGSGSNNKKLKPMLFNLDQDVGEQRSVAGIEPEIVAEMKALLTKHRSQGLAE